jgi:hypothetical protein
MKRLIAIFICLGFVLSITVAYAAPVGNIATPSTLKKGIIYQPEDNAFAVVAGGEIDLTFDRKIKHQTNDTKFNAYGGKIGILLMERFMPYTVLGVGQAEYKETILGTDVKFETKYDFVWSVGGTVMLYETKPGEMGDGIFRIGVDGRYRQSDLDLDKVTIGGTEYKKSDLGLTKADLDIKEWQIALGLSYQVQQFIPYIGVKYSDLRGDVIAADSTGEYKDKIKADNNVGIFVGGDLVINDTVSANIEGRFIDETAMSFGLLVRF